MWREQSQRMSLERLVKLMELKLKELKTEQKQDTKKEIISVFAEIVTDARKKPVEYVENWEAPGGGE